MDDEHLIVRVPNEPTQDWHEVADFADSSLSTPQYTVDSVTGEVRFGPAVRQPNGDIKLYGQIPPRGATLIFKSYRYGGGDEGNVEIGKLNTLKTAIPYINSVRNRAPAWGGLDAETLEDAMVRAPKIMRHRERAVTAEDYENLALQTPNVSIGQVKCLQPLPSDTGQVAPGQVYVLVIPRVRKPEGYLSPEELEPDAEDIARLTAYLDKRRLLTTRLYISSPAYRWVAAKVQLRAGMDADEGDVTAEVLSRLYRFLNPLTGGPKGQGWPFGRELFLSDVYQCLQGIANVQFIRSVELFITDPGGGPKDDPVESVEVVAHGVIVSGVHEVEFV
jgi:predicted phage baseplate assembly protein